jgi:hypothetical protein
VSESSDGVKLVFSQNLKIYLEAHRYSLKEFAHKIGVPISTVHGWLNGVPPKNVIPHPQRVESRESHSTREEEVLTKQAGKERRK